VYCTGISQPPNGTIFAPSLTCSSYSAVFFVALSLTANSLVVNQSNVKMPHTKSATVTTARRLVIGETLCPLWPLCEELDIDRRIL